MIYKEKIYFALTIWFVTSLVLLAVFSTLQITGYFLCFGLVVAYIIMTYEILKAD
jgi:hypothetical protein